MKSRINLIVLFLLVSICGCGYTTRGAVYSQNRLYVVPVVNKMDISSEQRKYSEFNNFPALLDKRVTNAIVAKFNSDGHMKVTNDEQGALKLTCAITNYHSDAQRYTDNDDVKEQKIWLDMSMSLTDPSGKVLKEKNIVADASYYLTGSNRRSEATVQDEVISDAARRIVEAVVEEW